MLEGIDGPSDDASHQGRVDALRVRFANGGAV